MRVDDLGHETKFVIVNDLTPHRVEEAFKQRVTEMALGYTRTVGVGGWKGKEEQITTYAVASLTQHQIETLVDLLLRGSRMKDIYVVMPGGMARGYCAGVAAAPPPTQSERFGQDRGNSAPVSMERFHGTRDTGWDNASYPGRVPADDVTKELPRGGHQSYCAAVRSHGAACDCIGHGEFIPATHF